MDEPEVVADLDDVVERLQAQVEDRRRSGAYPPGLEERLEAHFRRIVTRRATPDHTGLRARMAELEKRSHFDASAIHAQSQRPGGEVLHKAVSRLIARQTQGVLDQVQRYAEGMRDVLAGVADSLEDPLHVHADLVEQLDAVLERLAAAERRAVAAEAALAELTVRVDQLEASSPPAP